MISGSTALIAHIGYPTQGFKSPLIYNPYFARAGIDAVVVPMSCPAAAYPNFLKSVFTLTNVIGALITMPHKVNTVSLLDEASTAVRIAGACNAVRRGADGRLQGDLFDGEGFVRGLQRRGCTPQGAQALVVGCGGVGSAIAAALCEYGVARLSLYDVRAQSAEQLAQRLHQHYPQVALRTDTNDPADHDIVVNATPLGMATTDPLPVDVNRIASHSFVADVVMAGTMTPFLETAKARGCRYQLGVDMLFEQIPAYLEFFGLPTTTPEKLRSLARIGL